MADLTPVQEVITDAIQVALCLCVFKKTFLLLLRHPQKPLGLLWDIPGGKLLPNESPLSGAIRELEEETGIRTTPDELKNLGSYLISYEGKLYQFYTFLHVMNTKEEHITLSDREHIAFTWMPHSQIDSLDLLEGGPQLIEIAVRQLQDAELRHSSF